MKKLGCLVLAIVLFCSCVATAFAVSGTEAVGYTLRTTAKCNVRSAADVNSTRVGEVKKGNEYTIYGAVRYGSGKYWYLISAKDRMVWISSTQVKVLSDSYDDTSAVELYWGWCSVKNKSVRIYSDYSADRTRVDIAYAGDSFIISSVDEGDDGETWYELYTGERIVGWIKASAVNTTWY